MALHPWLTVAYTALVQSLDRLPPGLLMLGKPGIGKRELSIELARVFLCQDPSPEGYCGNCERCRSFHQGIVPDFHLLVPEALELDRPLSDFAGRYLEDGASKTKSARSGQWITISQIRLLIERLATHGHSVGQKVVLIFPANRLNTNAANALLKILEEPPQQTRFILVSDDRSGIPATILSRVSEISVKPPQSAVALQWLVEQGIDAKAAVPLLQAARGGPLLARALHEDDYLERQNSWKILLLKLTDKTVDPVVMGAAIGKESATDFVTWLEQALCDAIAIGHGKSAGEVLDPSNTDDQQLASKLNFKGVWDMISRLQVYLRRQRTSVDEQLFLEDVLIAIWQKV